MVASLVRSSFSRKFGPCLLVTGHCKSRLEIGRRLGIVVTGYCLIATAHWLLPTGYCPLATDHWLLPTG